MLCFCCCHCSNIGGATINDVALDFWHSGQNREDIGMEDLEHRLRAETMESQGEQYSFCKGCLVGFLKLCAFFPSARNTVAGKLSYSGVVVAQWLEIIC